MDINTIRMGVKKKTDTERNRFKKGLVTVVVPVYNAQQFVGENIESIINQSYQELQIIYVCDGCTDHTVEILDEYAKNDARIIVREEIHNHGAAVSRNIGMHMATGDWIIFLDADDIFDSHMIEAMLEAAVKNQADMAICFWECFEHKPDKSVLINDEMKKWCCETYPIIETKKELYQIMQIVDTSPWTKLIHKSIYTKEEVFFQDIPNANDIYYSIIAAVNSNKIVYIEKVLIHYRSSKGRPTLSADRMYGDNYVFAACDKVFDYIKHKKNRIHLLKSFYNNVFYCLYSYLGYEIYDTLFDALRNIYLDRWDMKRADIVSQLNYINRIFYKNIFDNKKEKNVQKIFMQARIEFIRELSPDGCSIWGAGFLGSNLLKEISNTDIKIQHVYDSSPDKWGKTIYGYQVEKGGNMQSDHMIVSTPQYFDDIKKQMGSSVKHVYNLELQIWKIPCEECGGTG